MSDALFDFKMGFWGTTVLAVFFVALGALIIFGSGRSLAEITQMQAGAFARMLIDMYTAVLGQWARPVIALAAFTTMLSTTLTCLDAFPRVLQRSSELFLRKTTSEKRGSRIYAFWIILVATGATGLLAGVSGQSMAIMVDFATTLSFVTAPVLATFNFIAVTGKHIGPQLRPATWMRRFSFFGLVFLYGFALYFLWFRFCA